MCFSFLFYVPVVQCKPSGNNLQILLGLYMMRAFDIIEQEPWVYKCIFKKGDVYMITIKRTVAIFSAVMLMVFAGCFLVYAEEESWTCPGCRAINNTNFCTQCGTQRPETITSPGCGEKYPVDTSDIFCGNCGAKLQEVVKHFIRLEGNGFDTPEEAVTYYLEGLKNLDFEQILGAFAWETQAEHFSTETKLRRIMAYFITQRPRMLGDSDFIRTANLYSLLAAQIDAIYSSLELYILQEDHPLTSTSTGSISLEEDVDFEEFKSKFNNGRVEKLAELTNIRFFTPDEMTDNKFSMGQNPENYIKQNAMYGADETVGLPAVADVGDELLYCCPTVARYGEKWYLVSVFSMTNNILGINTISQAFACGEGDISEIIGY